MLPAVPPIFAIARTVEAGFIKMCPSWRPVLILVRPRAVGASQGHLLRLPYDAERGVG